MVSQHTGKVFLLHHISRALHRTAIPDRCLKAYARSLSAGEVLKCVQELPPFCWTLPSTRVVYYLHTAPATWNEASDVCNSYGATLISFHNYQDTNSSVRYVNTHSWDNALDSLHNGFWTGLYRNSKGRLRWQGCADYKTSALPKVTTAATNPPPCYMSNTNFDLSTLQCNAKLPYICQRHDGQCWFQPYVNTLIKDKDVTHSHVNDTTASDAGECARLCRSAVEKGRECWAFSFRHTSCTLQFSSVPNVYALHVTPAVYHTVEGSTAYVKICTGGWKTAMTPTEVDNSITAKDENCTGTTSGGWDDSVCYCQCDQPPIILEAETLVMTIDEKVEKIVKELQVDPQNTSSTRRKKISIEDPRPSAQGIGYFGVAFLVVIFGGIFLLDINVLISHAAQLCKSVSGKNKSEA